MVLAGNVHVPAPVASVALVALVGSSVYSSPCVRTSTTAFGTYDSMRLFPASYSRTVISASIVTVVAEVVIERATCPSISRYRGRPVIDANRISVDPNDALNKSLYTASTPPTPRDGESRVRLSTAVIPGVLAPT